MNVAQSSRNNLKNKMSDIYKGAVEFEDTAHYRFTKDGNKRYAPWISFLDLKIEWNINTMSGCVPPFPSRRF